MSPSDSIPFVHLGARSEASQGESIARVEELCWQASRDEQGFLGLTDANSLGRAPAFAVAAARAGLRPVFGAELNVLPLGEAQYRGTAHRVRVLVENAVGWRALLRLANRARRAESATRPAHVSFASLFEDPRGLLFFVGGNRGELTRLLQGGELERAESYLREVADRLTPHQLFVELPEAALSNGELAGQFRGVARYLEAPLVAIPEVCCAHPADDAVFRFFAGDVPLRAAAELKLSALLRPTTERRHLASRAQVAAQYKDFPEAVSATLEVANRCAGFAIPQPDRRFPIHDFGRGVDAESFIWNTAFERAAERYGDLPTRYKERLNREFREIVDAGLANAVVTLVRLNDEFEAEGVQRGPGAGLFTNSVIASLLGLTKLDPLRFELSFELSAGLAGGPFPLLEAAIPGGQEGAGLAALKRLFDGQVCAVGEWRGWKAGALLDRAAEVLGRDGRWAAQMQKSPAFGKAREAVSGQPATFQPGPDTPLESPEALAWLVDRMEGRIRDLVAVPGLHTFTIEPLENSLPQRYSAPGRDGAAPMIASEWTSEELSRLRHGRLAFIHPPLLDLVGDATMQAREQGDPDFSPERTASDDALTYRLLREGLTAGIQPLESPLVRARLRQGQPTDLHSLIRLLTTQPTEPGERFPQPDFATILLCHVCAAIKAHRPQAFFAAALSQAANDPRRSGLLLEEARARGIAIHPLDINYSAWKWSLEREALRPGLLIVRGLGAPAAEEIIAKRREMHFANLADLCQRTERGRVRESHVRALIKSGALDAFGPSRRAMATQLEEIFPALRAKKAWNPNAGQLSIFSDAEAEQARASADEVPLSGDQWDTVGIALVEEDAERRAAFLAGAGVRRGFELQPRDADRRATLLLAAGPVADSPMGGGARLIDAGGVLVRAAGAIAEQLAEEKLAGRDVLLTGKLLRDGFQWRMEGESLATVDAAIREALAVQALQLDLSEVPEPALKKLLAALKRFPGRTQIAMHWLPPDGPRVLRSIASRKVLMCPLLAGELNELAGSDRWKADYTPPPPPPARMGFGLDWMGLGKVRKLMGI